MTALAEADIRLDERAKCGAHLEGLAKHLLHCQTSDVTDGYVAAVLMELAREFKKPRTT